MRVRKADNLTPWSADSANAGIYGPNSLVFYQKDENTQGFAYRAKSTYVQSIKPPDEDDNWAIDYTFYSPWSEKAKYSEGARVYYFNGSNTYGYRATIRHFGGNGKPNEEVDDDNIRTWELDFDYGNSYELPSEFLVPVKKTLGYYDGRLNSFNETDPEERPQTFEVRYGESGQDIYTYNAMIVSYLEEKGILSKDWSEVNSIYQSFSYDQSTYNFYEGKYDADGKPIKRKSGLHWAAWYKKINPNYPFNKNGVSQAFYTTRSSFWSDNFYYYRKHGFAIEMWPNATEDDYELIPTAGLKKYGLNIVGSVDSARPQVVFGVRWTQYYAPVDTLGLGPEMNPDDAKLDAYFYRNLPAFDDRTGDINFLYAYYPPQTNSNIVPPVRYSFFKQTIDSYAQSYQFNDTSSTVRKRGTNPIDFGNFIPSSGSVNICIAGRRWY
jgi:hypothetical protein